MCYLLLCIHIIAYTLLQGARPPDSAKRPPALSERRKACWQKPIVADPPLLLPPLPHVMCLYIHMYVCIYIYIYTYVHYIYIYILYTLCTLPGAHPAAEGVLQQLPGAPYIITMLIYIYIYMYMYMCIYIYIYKQLYIIQYIYIYI